MDCKSGCGGRLQVRGDQAFATCPKCRKGNCLKCQAVHEGKSCRQYQMSIRPKGSPEKTTAQNRSPAVSSPFASAPEKSPGQAPYPAAPPVVANDDDSSEKLVQCHVHGCAGQAFVGKEDAMFRCPLCGHFNCLKCEAIHESMTCAEYENNQGSVASVVLKPRRQSEEGSEDDEEQQAADDDAEGMIVECRFGNCNGYSFVIKTATIAQCELCHHWTCVSCKACHESQSCAQYKGIDVPEESAAPEPTVSRPKNSAGSTAHGFMSTVKTKITSIFASSDSRTGEELPVQTPDVVRSTNDGGFYTGIVSGARGHTEHKKMQIEVFDE